MSQLRDRARGCLVGGAVGDALGGPTEGWTPAQIVERYGGPVEGIVGPYYENWREARPLAPFHNGDGRITDDTLMVHALVRVYGRVRDHLDAYDVRRAPGARATRHGRLDSRARGRGPCAAAAVPGREVAGAPAAPRPRRPSRGGRGEHRELRRRHVHGTGRRAQRGQPRRRVRRGHRDRRRPPVQLRARGRRGLRRRRRCGDGHPERPSTPSWTRAWTWRTTVRRPRSRRSAPPPRVTRPLVGGAAPAIREAVDRLRHAGR